MVLPLYAKGDLSLAANVHIGRLFRDHERKGFFRIGVMPLLVGEKVQIEVFQPHRAFNALSHLQNRLVDKQRRRVELRDVEFIFPPETTPRMRVGRLRMIDEERGELLNVRIQVETESSWPKAVLILNGPNAGQVSTKAGGGSVVNVFRPAEDLKPMAGQ